MSTAVVSDTSASIPAELLRRHDIHEVSLYVNLEGNQQRESDITDYDEFYARLAASSEPVTTSQPSIGDFLEVWEPLLADGREVVSIHISSGLSGTCEAAIKARQRLIEEETGGERVHVVDSGSGGGGAALVTLAAATVASGGADAEATVAAAHRASEDLKILFAVDTLEYLRRGGRIGAAQAWIGTALKIKPILTFRNEVTPVERVRTSSRAYAKLLEHARERKEAGATLWLVHYIQNAELAGRLAEECRGILGCEPVLVSELSPVIGAHIGPGLLGFGGTVPPS